MMKGATSSGVKRPRSASASSQPTAGATKQPKTEKTTVASAASTQKRPAARPAASAPAAATKPRVASSSAPATTQRKEVVTSSTAAVPSKPTTTAAKTPAAVSTAKKPATAAGKKAPPVRAPAAAAAGKSSASEKKKAAPIPTAVSLAKVKMDEPTSEKKVKKSSTPLISRFAVTTYHNVMVGYEVYDKALLAAASANTNSAEGTQSAPQLLITQSFIAKHHVGCVTCSACHDKTIISAGTDERLFIYKNAFSQQTGRCTTTVVGSTCPASEVVCAAFPNNKFLLCGCHDGTLGVYQTKDWDPTAVIEVHDSSLTDLAIHPSGALAITTGKDRYVAFVDTVRGNVVTRHRFSVLDGYPTAVRVSPDGKEVAVLTSHALHLIDASTAVVTARMTVERQPPFELQCLCYVKSVTTGEHVLVVGDESGRLLTPRKKTGEVGASSSKSAATTVVSTAAARAVPKKKAASTKAKVVTAKEDDEDEDEEDEEHNSEEDEEEEEANSSPKNNNKKQEPSDGGLELVQCGVVTDNEKRVRAMCLLGATSGGVGSGGKVSKAEDAQRSFLVTCDPDGVVALWRCEEDKKAKNKELPSFTKVGEKATGARCTGLCAF